MWGLFSKPKTSIVRKRQPLSHSRNRAEKGEFSSWHGKKFEIELLQKTDRTSELNTATMSDDTLRFLSSRCNR